MLRVLLVADSHGVLDSRIEAQLAGCDWAVHAGDIGNADVLDRLGAASQVCAVRGNNDQPSKWPAQDVHRLAQLNEEARLNFPGGELVVVHGHRVRSAAARHAELRRIYPQARAVVYGHSHRQVCDQQASPWILNPGACGRARTYGGPSCLLLSIAGSRWNVEPIRFPPLPRSKSP
ncbi:MAG: metallophosphoesterase family protein [Chromatiales bacterium]|nr:metallophosphoesterase family protein [Chromatiales bacterium]